MSDTKTPDGLALLRVPFQAHQISKLPKPFKKDSPKGNCRECGGYHGLPAMHLDYVGHAALTDRLLDADLHWSWEPVADPKSLGLPVADGMWIRLTVRGVTRYGFGCADGKSGGDAVKEMIGDALRNAAMRFGAALDLWHKGSLHESDEDGDANEAARPNVQAAKQEAAQAPAPSQSYEEWLTDINALAESGAGKEAVTKAVVDSHADHKNRLRADRAKWKVIEEKATKAEAVPA